MEGFKKVEIQLPKVDNPKNFKVQISFSLVTEVGECSNAFFSLNPNVDIIKSYGTPLNYNRPYYSIQNPNVDITVLNPIGCNSIKRYPKKVMCDIEYLIDYKFDYAIPFYIPKNWSLEYKIWRADNQFKTVN